MSNLSGKTVVVTGGNSGIGLATAIAFKQAGATVIITGRNAAITETAAKENGFTGIVADQADITSITQLAQEIKEKHGNIDSIFLNAGLASFSPFETATEQHYDQLMDTNVKGVFFTLQKLLPLVNNGGSVVFNTSVNASLAAPGSIVYAASKAALLSFNKVLAGELAERKIRVNAVSPGPIATPLYGKLGLSQEETDGFSAMLGKKLLSGRFGTPEEVAKAVIFLASDDALFITGTELIVDGGLTVNTVVR